MSRYSVAEVSTVFKKSSSFGCYVSLNQWFPNCGTRTTSAAMSNPNGLLSQKLCLCRNHQGRRLNDMLMRAAHWMAYFVVSKL